jgi:hypothetical protein
MDRERACSVKSPRLGRYRNNGQRFSSGAIARRVSGFSGWQRAARQPLVRGASI